MTASELVLKLFFCLPLSRSSSLRQWQDILKTAIKAAIILYIFDRLRLISDMVWFGACSSIESPLLLAETIAYDRSMSAHRLRLVSVPCSLPAEHHIDVLSVQAALAKHQRFGWMDRTIQYIKFTSRVA